MNARSFILWGGLAAVVAVASAVGTTPEKPARAQPLPDVKPAQSLDACINKGIAYYQGTGAYPRLLDGTNAVDEARRRCRLQSNPYP